jgi:S-adenosylmethionine/arginine decarboxylase-like enzyme|tara:strand:- start:258 stop:473 length:216 start_codon:yes stop_codon:yes gene_type:complete
MTSICTPAEWASDLIRNRATLEQVNVELVSCGIQDSDPTKAEQVRHEFLKQTLANMAVAKRGRQQYKGWKQ